MGGGDMKHDGCLPYSRHDYHPHGRHHHDQYYDLPHEHHVHGSRGQFSPKFINDLAPVDFVAGHPDHGGHHMIMRRGGRHHHHLIPIFHGLHNKSLHHRAAGKMHHHHHGHDHSHHDKHKLGRNRFWHPNMKGHHGGRRHHRCHEHKYYDLHRESDRCHGDYCGRSKSVSNSLPDLITENRPATGDVDHPIRNSTTSDEKELVAAVEVVPVQQQPDDHEYSMELANIPININTLRIE